MFASNTSTVPLDDELEPPEELAPPDEELAPPEDPDVDPEEEETPDEPPELVAPALPTGSVLPPQAAAIEARAGRIARSRR
jgi:hypothetical protein